MMESHELAKMDDDSFGVRIEDGYSFVFGVSKFSDGGVGLFAYSEDEQIGTEVSMSKDAAIQYLQAMIDFVKEHQ